MRDVVTLTVDDADVRVPRDRMILRACETEGVEIPRFHRHERERAAYGGASSP